MLKILLISDFTSEYSRLLLKGFFRYSMKMDSWSFYRIPLDCDDHYEDKVIEIAQRWGADAIMGQLSDVDVERLRSIGIPIVLQNYTNRVNGISNITGDYYGTGEIAANFFLKKGYTNFAFYGTDTTIWSREREDGYRSRLAEIGKNVYVYNEHSNIRYNSTSNIHDLEKWLANLPKSIALFACDDSFALRITEVCGVCNIRIPSDISVLGVDNDEILCNMSNPPLSSIVLDTENGGFRAAQLLHQIVEKKELPQFNIEITPIRIERRSSTEGYLIKDELVSKAIQLIENGNLQLTIIEILNTLCVSRRVLEKHFRKEIGMSIYQYMLDYRANCFSEQLLISDLPIMDIAINLGYDDYTLLSKTFKRIYNMTPTQYRNYYKYGKINNGINLKNEKQ